MGQYHIPVNLDRKEYFSPHRLGDGLKALEQALSGPGGVPTALHALLTVSNGRGGGDYGTNHPLAKEVLGRWGGQRVAIVGDYAESGDIPKAEGIEPVLYSLCSSKDGVDGAVEWWRSRLEAENISNDEKAAIRNYIDLALRWGPFTDISDLLVTYLSEGVDDYYHAFSYKGDGWGDRSFDLKRRSGV
jgi:hypothetical protein